MGITFDWLSLQIKTSFGCLPEINSGCYHSGWPIPNLNRADEIYNLLFWILVAIIILSLIRYLKRK